MKRVSVLLVVSAVFVAGCASPPYVPAQGQPQAQVRLVTNSTDLTQFHVVDSASCPSPPLLKWVSVGPGRLQEVPALKMLGHASGPVADRAERVAQAGQPLMLWAQSYRPSDGTLKGNQCRGGIQFVPEPGRQYEVNYRLDNTVFTRYCSLSVEELVADGSPRGFRRVAVPTRKQVRYVPDFCEAS